MSGVRSVRLARSSQEGLEAITVENELLSVTMLPELGGKLTSMRDLRTGREWLWANEPLRHRKLEYGASYVTEAASGGWDECFPTVAECTYPLAPWNGTRVPDHGEIWPQAWKLTIREADGAVALHTEAAGVAFPYRFERLLTVRPGSNKIRFDYRVSSTSDSDFPFIWSAHPLLAIEPGMRLLLPGDTTLHAYLSVPGTLLPQSSTYRWPPSITIAGRELDLARLPDQSERFAFKLWSEPLSHGKAWLRAHDGSLEFAFDTRLVPQIGVWLNAGGWSGDGGEPYYHLALEPCIGAQDSLQEAVEIFDQYEILPARGTREWWLEARLTKSVPERG